MIDNSVNIKKRFLILVVLFSQMGCDDFGNNPEDVQLPIEYYTRIDRNPSWAPNGKNVAFSKFGSNDATGIYLVNVDGSEKTIVHSGNASQPDWSPNSIEIAFKESGQIFIKKIQSDSLIQVTDSPGNNHSPKWSPNGESIVYTKSINTDSINSGVWVTNIEGDEVFITRYGLFPNWLNDEEIVYKLSEYDEKGGLLYHYLEKINTRTFERNILESTIGKWLGNDIKFNKKGTEFLFTGISEKAIISTFKHNILTEENILIQEFSEGANWSNTEDAIVFTNLRIDDGYLWVRYDSKQIIQLTSE